LKRALKFLIGSMLAIGLLFVAFAYGLYFQGARAIPPDWGPTTAQYPESVRLALWRSYGGQGAPVGNPLSPPEFAWRLYRSDDAPLDHRPTDPSMTMAYRVARIGRLARSGSMSNYHLMQAAATIRASNWPVESQLDTVLDQAYFGGAHENEILGLREGARRVYGLPVSGLDEARIHVLLVLMEGPSYLDPWCHPDRLRKRVLIAATRWSAPPSLQQLEAALSAIGPPPTGSWCSKPGG
jgi:hypothetical protein